MDTRERVELIRAEYPGYDRPLDAKVRHSERYGVVLCRRARELLGETAAKKTNKWYISARVKDTFVTKGQVEKWLDICGYKSKDAWINRCIKSLQGEAANRLKGAKKDRAGAGTPNADK